MERVLHRVAPLLLMVLVAGAFVSYDFPSAFFETVLEAGATTPSPMPPLPAVELVDLIILALLWGGEWGVLSRRALLSFEERLFVENIKRLHDHFHEKLVAPEVSRFNYSVDTILHYQGNLYEHRLGDMCPHRCSRTN